MDKSAAIYARVATKEQASGLLGNQIEQLRTYLSQKGYTKIEVYSDEGYSGKNLSRHGFKRLISDLEQFEAIAVSSLDRISKNHDDVLRLIHDYLRPLNKRLLVSTSDIDSSTLNGYMFIALMNCFYEYESKLMVGSIIEEMNC